jgi:hypothetical protein
VAAQLERGASAGGFVRAALYGTGAALLSAIVWFAIIKATGMTLGLVAIAVGYFVGYAVRRGAGGRGGGRYQALAIALTYAGIAMSYVPLLMIELSNRASSHIVAGADGQDLEIARASSVAPVQSAEEAPGPIAVVRAAERAGEAEPAVGLGDFLAFLAVLVGFAFSIPFRSIMGVVILGIALYEAWKINRPSSLEISGPFELTGAAAASGEVVRGG